MINTVSMSTSKNMHVCAQLLCVRLFETYGLYPTRLLCPWDSPGKNTGVGCHFLLQRIFPTQRSNPYLWHLLHCRQVLYPLSHLGVLSTQPWLDVSTDLKTDYRDIRFMEILLTHIYGIKKDGNDDPICETAKETQM